MPVKKTRRSIADQIGSRTVTDALATAELAANNPRPELEEGNQRISYIVASARRPDDLMIADIVLRNFRVITGSSPSLVRRDASQRASITLLLPPQSFGEEALLDSTEPEVGNDASDDFPDAGQGGKNAYVKDADTVRPLGFTRIRMSGATKLAFTMPPDVTSIPFTLEAILLACRSWPARRALTAQPASAALLAGNMAGVRSGDMSFLRTMVASDEFHDMRRTLAAALDHLGVGEAVAAVETAGRALARQIAEVMGKGDDVAAARLVATRMNTAVTGILTRFPVLRSATQTRSLVEAGLGYAAAEALTSSVGSAGAAEVRERVPLVTALFAPFRPTGDLTAIEMPYRLLLSPIGDTKWQHHTKAIERQGRHEIWHTQLGPAGLLGTAGGRTNVRAIWSDDSARTDVAALSNDLKPFRMPLDPLDRSLLVRLTAGFREEREDGEAYVPQPLLSRRLILSALGGSLDVEGTWTVRPRDVDLEQWQHRMSLGRDHYVRVVYAGFLLPFGHAASLIKVTERKFEATDTQTPLQKRVAQLRQRFFLVVRESVKTFDGSRHHAGGHPFPFTSVELLTRTTPMLLAPDNVPCRVPDAGGLLYATSSMPDGLSYREAFWPMIGNVNFRFNIAATDRDGQRTTFAMPLLFVAGKANTASVTKSNVAHPFIDALREAYNIESDMRRQATLGGDSVCYAPPNPEALGDTRLPTDTLRFRVAKVAATSSTQLNAYPEVAEAFVALRAVQRILGRDDAKVKMVYDPVYAQQGFGPDNTGELFLVLPSNSPPWNVQFGSSPDASRTDAVGAVASPSMAIKGISRRMGMASDLDVVRTNQFNPSSFFSGAHILGGIALEDVIANVPTGLSGPSVPKFVTRDLPASGNLPARSEARYDWSTTLGQSDHLGILLPRADGSSESPFVMSAVTTSRAGAPSSASTVITATIGNFSVSLFGFIVLRFNRLTYRTTDGQKPDVTVEMHPAEAVMFGGPLRFINRLREFIPSNGFSDPSAITVTPSGISAGYSLTVPSAQVGVFALSGLSIGAQFNLPFDTQPMSVAFNFGKREDPFSLTVSLLGGGGFLMIGVGTDGVREIEGALEAQARLSIDLGVASGSVEISAGIYFHWLTGSGENGLVELSGYVRVHGEMSVMAVVSISITFNLQLGIDKNLETGKLVVFGEASVIVEVEVLVFSGEVTVRCRREFTSPYADPTFAELVPGHSTWNTYCLAFAAE